MALNTPLEDGGESSKRRCWDFTGQKYIPMAKEGYVWMCFTNPAVSGDNSTEIADGFHMLKVYPQTAAQITDNILSVSRMVSLPSTRSVPSRASILRKIDALWAQ